MTREEPTAKRIEDSIVEQIEQELNLRHQDDWFRVYLELQEDGTFLLISIELQSDASPERIKETCSLIKEIVEPRIRTVGDHVAWIGSVEVNGKVVGTMIPGIWHETE